MLTSENCCSRDHQLTYARSANPKNCSTLLLVRVGGVWARDYHPFGWTQSVTWLEAAPAATQLAGPSQSHGWRQPLQPPNWLDPVSHMAGGSPCSHPIGWTQSVTWLEAAPAATQLAGPSRAVTWPDMIPDCTNQCLECWGEESRAAAELLPGQLEPH